MKQTCEVVKVSCDKCDGNPDGFYECDTDKVPDGAVLFDEKETKQAPSFDYAVMKIDGDGFTGRAKVVKDTKEQAENYMLEKELDLDIYGIEERERK